MASVEKESRLLAARYAETQQVRQASQSLQKSISCAKNFLISKGVGLPSPSAPAAGTDESDIVAVASDVSAYMRLFSDEKAVQGRDERGFQKSWEGVSMRLTEEMHACFPASGLELQDQTPEVCSGEG